MYSRRQLLRVTPLVVVGLSGCLDDADAGSATVRNRESTPTLTASETSTPQPTPRPEATTTQSSTSTPEATPTATPAPTPTPEPTATITVRLSQGSFEPRRLRVDPNTRVRWVNDDVDDHRIRSMRVDEATTAWEYTSPTFGRGSTVSMVFREPGVYAYYSPTYGRSTSCGLVAVGDATFDGDLPCESGY